MLIIFFFLQFKDLDYQGLTPGVEALAMAGVPTAACFSNPSQVHFNPAGLSIMPGSIIRYERYLTRETTSDTERLPDYSFSLISPQLSFTYHPVVSFDETTTVDTSSIYEKEHRRVNITEYILTLTSRSGNELTYKERIYFGFNVKVYSGNFFSVKATRAGNQWQEPQEMITSTLSPGFDVGLIFWYNKVSIGGMIEDVYTRMSWKEQDAFVLKRTFRGALGLRPVNKIFISGGLEYRDNWMPAGGAEIFIGKDGTGLAVRGGLDYDLESNKYHYSGGVGIHSPRVRLDGGIRYLDPGMLIAIALSVTG